jgi:hypothetical protein
LSSTIDECQLTGPVENPNGCFGSPAYQTLPSRCLTRQARCERRLRSPGYERIAAPIVGPLTLTGITNCPLRWIDVQALVRVRRKPFARLSWTDGLALGFATLPDRLKRDLEAEVGALA